MNGAADADDDANDADRLHQAPTSTVNVIDVPGFAEG